MSKKETESTSKTTKRNDGRISAEEITEANKRATEMVPDYSGDTDLQPHLDYAPPGLRFLNKELTHDQKRILNGLISDAFADPEAEGIRPVYRKLYAAAKRMGFTNSPNAEREFFKTLADPDFNEITKVVGRGLVGLEALEVINTVIEQAKAGCKVSQKRVLEIIGLIDSKYDYYMKQHNQKYVALNAGGDINLGKRTDKELEDILASVRDVPEAAEVTS